MTQYIDEIKVKNYNNKYKLTKEEGHTLKRYVVRRICTGFLQCLLHLL